MGVLRVRTVAVDWSMQKCAEVCKSRNELKAKVDCIRVHVRVTRGSGMCPAGCAIMVVR